MLEGRFLSTVLTVTDNRSYRGLFGCPGLAPPVSGTAAAPRCVGCGDGQVRELARTAGPSRSWPGLLVGAANYGAEWLACSSSTDGWVENVVPTGGAVVVRVERFSSSLFWACFLLDAFSLGRFSPSAASAHTPRHIGPHHGTQYRGVFFVAEYSAHFFPFCLVVAVDGAPLRMD